MKVEENTISFYIDELVNSTLFNAEANLCLHHIFLSQSQVSESTLKRQFVSKDMI
jgi:hypothetical protein